MSDPSDFDHLVRADFFAGIAGDDARFTKAIERCERALEINPKHPEALVWHGAALLARAGQAFLKGDMSTGGPMFERGLQEMNDAVVLAPDNLAVLIPRGAVLLEATRRMPPEMADPLLESAVRITSTCSRSRRRSSRPSAITPRANCSSVSPTAANRLGDHDKARRYFDRLIADAPTSGQAPKAREWMATGMVPKSSGASCVGCHK